MASRAAAILALASTLLPPARAWLWGSEPGSSAGEWTCCHCDQHMCWDVPCCSATYSSAEEQEQAEGTESNLRGKVSSSFDRTQQQVIAQQNGILTSEDDDDA